MKGFMYWFYLFMIILVTLFLPAAILFGNPPLGRIDAIIGAILAFIIMASYTIFSFKLEREN